MVHYDVQSKAMGTIMYRLLEEFRTIPSMNPDISILGHLREKDVGANFNHERCSTRIPS
jgi:hypothetical protein